MNAVLDDILPAYRHRERHTTQIIAAPETVWSALHAVSASDLRLTRMLTNVRALPARLPEGRMPPGGLPADRTFIQAFMDRGYRQLRSVRRRRWWPAQPANPGGCAAAKPPTS